MEAPKVISVQEVNEMKKMDNSPTISPVFNKKSTTFLTDLPEEMIYEPLNEPNELELNGIPEAGDESSTNDLLDTSMNDEIPNSEDIPEVLNTEEDEEVI